MVIRIGSLACGALLLGALAGCGSDEGGAAGLQPTAGGCRIIEGQTYLSTTLQELGRAVDGLALGHWRLSFNGGVVESRQSDFILSGTYSCRANTITGEVNGAEFSFKAGADSFQFTPFAGTEPLQYQLQPKTSPDCDLVAGQRYENSETGDFATFAAEDGRVEFQLGDSAGQGRFDCDLGQLNLYHPAEPGAKPQPLELADDGNRLRFGDLELTRVATMACTEQYDPVCGVVPSGIQCITTPCPSSVYQTFPNQCYAGLAGAEQIQPGECGPLEGQPVDTPTCGAEDEPVCAVVPAVEPCHTAPCPIPVYQTLACAAEAHRLGASIVKLAACAASSEGKPANGPLPIGCTKEYAPVCALAKADIACITAPCPTHAYATYGNACMAGADLAQISFAGECGGLEGSVTFGEPPVTLVERQPENDDNVQVVSAEIEGDILTATVNYSGCGPQHVSLVIFDAFRESDPVQVGAVFQLQEQQLCDALLTGTYRYDLRPLKARYQAAYQTESGRIAIPALGLYEF